MFNIERVPFGGKNSKITLKKMPLGVTEVSVVGLNGAGVFADKEKRNTRLGSSTVRGCQKAALRESNTEQVTTGCGFGKK